MGKGCPEGVANFVGIFVPRDTGQCGQRLDSAVGQELLAWHHFPLLQDNDTVRRAYSLRPVGDDNARHLDGTNGIIDRPLPVHVQVARGRNRRI
jgi:hypothetical protein